MLSNSNISLGNRLIVIIEDEEMQSRVIATGLSLAGYQVIEAKNGEEGLHHIQEHHPDLVLCDITMEGKNGYEVLDSLKRDPALLNIPFIFLTGLAEKKDLRIGMEMGADDYLTKPVTQDELISAVEAVLEKKRRTRQFYEHQFDEVRSKIMLSLPHEFRTPLNGIIGFSQILKTDENLQQDEIRKIGAFIHKSGQRLHHLLENLLLYSQLQVWMQEPQKMVSLKEHVSSVAEVFPEISARLMEETGRINAITGNPGTAIVKVSGKYLAKMIEELLSNGLKFSRPGDLVTVTTSVSDETVKISISDRGRGMKRSQIRNVTAFLQFNREQYEQQGAGLGLVIVKQLAELHGGSIAIESAEKHGTTVHLYLPAVKTERVGS